MEYTTLILTLPLLTFLALGLLGTKLKPATAGCIGTLSLAICALLAYMTAWQYFSMPRVEGVRLPVTPFNFEWLRFTRHLHIDLGILLDPISVMMLVVITTVSLMVHVYSLGYMHGEKGFQRYYAFLSLFSFSMLGLVVATNIFQMYIFWELVGVSSYLLIGFYYTKPEAVAASKKAFIVTRFADLGFLIGILLLSFYTKTFSFQLLTSGDTSLFAGAAGTTFMGCSVMSWAMALIFMGGAGKSAMFPLHIWLPDAMEGPTPVSALIHAATMVVAGVYLVARLFPVYYFEAPEILVLIAVVGAVHLPLRRGSRLRANRHQTRAGLLHHLPDRLHDGRPRRLRHGRTRGTGIHGLHVPPLHPRHVQSLAIPRRGSHHPRRPQQRDEPHGRTSQIFARHARHLPRRLPRHLGYTPLLRVLQ